MRVIAIKEGYDGVQFRDPAARNEDGQPVVFEMPDGQRSSWFVEVDDEGKPLTPIKKEPKKRGREGIPGQGPERGAQHKADPQLGDRSTVPGQGPARPSADHNPIA